MRRENLRDVLGRNATAGIARGNPDERLFRIEGWRTKDGITGGGSRARSKHDFALAGHGLQGIDADIDQHLHELHGIGLNRENRNTGLSGDPALTTRGMGAQEQRGIFHQRRNIDDFRLRARRAGEPEEALRNFLAPLDFALNRGQAVLDVGRGIGVPLVELGQIVIEQLNVARNNTQRII